jgi:hypothetical protein
MAQIKDKVQNALDETRMLILGAQVLLGFQFRAVFEPGFDRLPEHARYLKLIGLALMTIAVGLLMAPGPYHQIVERGEDTPNLHRYTTRIAELALLPFAVAFGLDMFVAAEKLTGSAMATVAGILMTLVALFFWYGLEVMHKAGHEAEAREVEEMEKQQPREKDGGTRIKDKIKHVLTEARVVLPGAQTLLGFQFSIFLMEGFDKLPASSRYVHFASLTMVALSIVLLMTPAAYHRIVERGNGAARLGAERRLLPCRAQSDRKHGVCRRARQPLARAVLWPVVRLHRLPPPSGRPRAGWHAGRQQAAD